MTILANTLVKDGYRRGLVRVYPKWSLTVSKPDGEVLFETHEAEDWIEIKALASEARSASPRYRIFYTRPGETQAEEWV